MLLGYNDNTPEVKSVEEFERGARTYVSNYLRMVPRLMRTPDPQREGINLTARSYLAPKLADFMDHMW
jgi:hypothetical protein